MEEQSVADSFTRSIYAAAIFSSRHGLYRNEPSVKIARSSRNVAVVARAAVGADTVSSADLWTESSWVSIPTVVLEPDVGQVKVVAREPSPWFDGASIAMEGMVGKEDIIICWVRLMEKLLLILVSKVSNFKRVEYFCLW